MCGIAGKLVFDGSVDHSLIDRMCDTMEHRGPDSRGVYFEPGVGLGMQRLAIIDVEGGSQPFFSEDRTVVGVMNGEIYNFRDIRRGLLKRGHRLSSQSDSEVLVHLYEEQGDRLVESLRGMFAFAVWDGRRRRLLLGRDRVGMKPLFWARRGATVWFASEVRALLQDPEIDRDVDLTGISAYLALQYVPHPLSGFRTIRKVPPATTLLIDSAGEQSRCYWTLNYAKKLARADQPELEERLRTELLDATRVRLMSEVPLGAFLSGGVDSSAVVWAMAQQMQEPVKTFSIGFSEADHDELSFARMVSSRFATEHHEFVVEPRALEIMPKLARHYGEPFADSSALPSFYLSEMTGRHVTVALNGDGGDEAFAGYQRYSVDTRVRQLDWMPLPLQRLIALARHLPEGSSSTIFWSQIRRAGKLLSMDPLDRYSLRMSIFDRDSQRRLLSPDFAAAVGDSPPDLVIREAWESSSARSLVDRLLDTDTRTYLPGDLLVKMDIATMAHSVEARSPFLDHQLLEFAASLPADQKLRGGAGKHILKNSLRGHLPDQVLDRQKMGFAVPLARWFRNELRHLPAEVLLDKRTEDRGYFQATEVRRLIDEHQRGRADHSARLWLLLQLEYWHREVVDPSPDGMASGECP